MDDLYEKDIMILAHNFTTCICLNIYDKLSYSTDKELKINFLIFFDFIQQKLEIKNNTEEDVKNSKKILLRICNKNISNSEKYIDKIISNTYDFDIYEYKNLFLLFKDYFIKTLIIHFFQNLTKDNYKLDFYNYLKYLFYYVSNIYEVSDIFSFRKKLKKTKDTDEIFFKFINYDELKDITYKKKHNENQEIIKKNKDNINLLFYNFIMYFCIYYYDIIFNKFNDHFDIFIKFINEKLNITDKTLKDDKRKLYEDKSSEKIKTETIDKLIENKHDDLDNTEKKEIILHFKSFFISSLIKFNFKNYMNEYTKITDDIYTSFYTKLFEKIKGKIFVDKLNDLIFIESDVIVGKTNITISTPVIESSVIQESSETSDDNLRLAEEAREKQERDNEIALAKKRDEENARRQFENYDMEISRISEETAKAEALLAAQALERQKRQREEQEEQIEREREQERQIREREEQEERQRRQREEQEEQIEQEREQEEIQRRHREEQEKIQRRQREEQEERQQEEQERQKRQQEEQQKRERQREEQERQKDVKLIINNIEKYVKISDCPEYSSQYKNINVRNLEENLKYSYNIINGRNLNINFTRGKRDIVLTLIYELYTILNNRGLIYNYNNYSYLRIFISHSLFLIKIYYSCNETLQNDDIISIKLYELIDTFILNEKHIYENIDLNCFIKELFLKLYGLFIIFNINKGKNYIKKLNTEALCEVPRIETNYLIGAFNVSSTFNSNSIKIMKDLYNKFYILYNM
jgi:hypothetical protein